MSSYQEKIKRQAAIMIASSFAIWVLASTTPVFAHGGKPHSEAFTALQAVQKATELYDRLIRAQKLPEEWETGLSSIHVSTRQAENKPEFVVQFKRIKDEPNSVYFFFNREGEYSGSNFTGN